MATERRRIKELPGSVLASTLSEGRCLDTDDVSLAALRGGGRTNDVSRGRYVVPREVDDVVFFGHGVSLAAHDV
jgi:hypothetical protein